MNRPAVSPRIAHPSRLSPTQRLAEIARIIEDVEGRCMVYDGPVGDTREEMTAVEIRRIYSLALGS